MRKYLFLLFIGLVWTQPSIQWAETYGGNNFDSGGSVIENEAGELIIAGRSNVNATGQDGYIIKIDSSGQEIWANTYNASDGTQSDYINDIIETYDGGYLATGTSHTNTWLIKLDSDGNATWNNTSIGGGGFSVINTSDSSYVVGGYTSDSDGQLIKFNSVGEIQWIESYDQPGEIKDCVETTDLGFACTGVYSMPGNVKEMYLLKLDSLGQEEWNQTYGGDGTDEGIRCRQTNDNGYIILGGTKSYGDGSNNGWLVKTDSLGQEEWNMVFGDDGMGEYFESFDLTNDGGYILLGRINELEKMWVVKTDSLGQEEWSGLYNHNNNYTNGTGVIQLMDTGYFFLGNTDQSNYDIFALRLNPMSYEPQLEHIDDVEMLEDDLISLELNANHDYSYPITFYATTSTDFVSIELDSNILYFNPEENWYGSSHITVTALDTANNFDTTSFNLTVINVNDSPEVFELIYPTLIDTFVINNQSSNDIPFVWSESIDIDSDVEYTLNVVLDYFGNSFSQEYENISDTIVNISGNEWSTLMTNQNISMWTLDYSIEATDGEFMITVTDGEFVLINESLSLDEKLTPFTFDLHQNYPNPFNPTTQIKYDLPEDANVNITIYDMLGNEINQLVNEVQNSGYKSIQWSATNTQGQPVSAGVYLYSIEAGEFRQTKKMILLK